MAELDTVEDDDFGCAVIGELGIQSQGTKDERMVEEFPRDSGVASSGLSIA